MPVPLQQAVVKAVEFAAGTLGDRARDIRLEEVESLDNNGTAAWRITLSMLPAVPNESVFSVSAAFRRDYKTFTVLKDTGEVIAMKIREFAGE